MDIWSRIDPDEIERRRLVSVSALKEKDLSDFDRWYQEECDAAYWRNGQCCAGCDFWSSRMGWFGDCTKAGIVSGADVLRSMGFSFSSYMPPPGFPMTQGDFYCGQFRDDFDWQTLGAEYLARIGAMSNGTLKERPKKKAHGEAAP